MARAKNTDRAEARRRHREETRAASAQYDELDDDGLDAALTPQPATGGLRGMFQMPNIREDIRILPGMLAHTPKLWIPFAMLLVSFILAVAYHKDLLPTAIAGLASLYVELTLPPTALFVFFIGGFLAPRASYLVGAVLGLTDAILLLLLSVVVPGATVTQGTGSEGTSALVTLDAASVVGIIMVAVFVGILAAGFASWYRNFLRSSQERARQNRAAREQQQRVKAKEDARLARSTARQTSKVPAATTSTSSSTTPPAKR